MITGQIIEGNVLNDLLFTINNGFVDGLADYGHCSRDAGRVVAVGSGSGEGVAVGLGPGRTLDAVVEVLGIRLEQLLEIR